MTLPELRALLVKKLRGKKYQDMLVTLENLNYNEGYQNGWVDAHEKPYELSRNGRAQIESFKRKH